MKKINLMIVVLGVIINSIIGISEPRLLYISSGIFLTINMQIASYRYSNDGEFKIVPYLIPIVSLVFFSIISLLCLCVLFPGSKSCLSNQLKASVFILIWFNIIIGLFLGGVVKISNSNR